MKKGLRAAVATTAALAALVFAGGALAANTGSIAVWHTPMVLAGSSATTIHLTLPQADDPIAAINIYAGAGYGAKLDQAPGTNIGTVDATAFSHTNNLTLPLSGAVVTGAPANFAAQSATCARTPTSQAVWVLALSVAGQSITVPVFVNPTTGAEQAFGPYKLSVCFTPWDIPESLGGAPQGAQVLDVIFTVNGIFTTPTAPGPIKWDTLVTPYVPLRGTPNPAATFEMRAIVPLPIALPLKASYVRKTGTWRLSGRVTEGGLPVANTVVRIGRGPTLKGISPKSVAKTDAKGNWKASGRLVPKKTTYFNVSTTVAERDYTAAGCQNPVTSVAPAGCVTATLPKWSASSAVVRIKP